MLSTLFNHTHPTARHDNSRVLHANPYDPCFNTKTPRFRSCPCAVLKLALERGFASTLFKDMNSITLLLVFQQLAQTPSRLHTLPSGIGAVGLTEDGRVISYGARLNYFYPPPIHVMSLRNVVQVATTWNACAALTDSGNVYVWGSAAYGGNAAAVDHRLHNVFVLLSNCGAFAALKNDRTVVTWGGEWSGGFSPDLNTATNVVAVITHGPYKFRALCAE